MRILITGICGFVGSTLAEAWLENDSNVILYGIDNFARPGSEINRQRLRKLGIKLFHGDIRLASDFEGLPDVDWVVDAAANPSVLAGLDGQVSSRQVVEHNLIGTVNILEFCKLRQAGFILLSTSRVYSLDVLAVLEVEASSNAFHLRQTQAFPEGITEKGVSEACSTEPPLSLYGSTKRASEILALEYCEAFHVPVWINRCGVLAGAGQFGKADQGIFAYWINAWHRRSVLTYIGFGGTGHQVRDCLHPRDLVPLFSKQIESAGSVRVLNIGGGITNAISLAELSAWCNDRFGPHTVSTVPQSRPFDVPWLVMDATLAERVWDWRPQTSISSILNEIALHAERHPNWLEISEN